MEVARRTPLISFVAGGYARRMVWPDQDPPATDVLLHLTVPCAGGARQPGRMACRVPGHLTGDLLSLDARRDGQSGIGRAIDHLSR